MTKLEGRRTRLNSRTETQDDDQSSPPDNTPATTSDDPRALQADIPEHVWRVLQQAGERAAERLLQMLEGESFMRLNASAKARLIELALTRAYGLPVRRSLAVTLTSDDADAVAASLATLSDALPERSGEAQGRFSRVLDVTPGKDTKPH